MVFFGFILLKLLNFVNVKLWIKSEKIVEGGGGIGKINDI